MTEEKDLELYDADGNLIEDAAERFVAKEKVDELVSAKLAEKETELKTVMAEIIELRPLKNKDFNFKRLRDMNAEERTKLSVQELELRQRQENIEEETKKIKEQHDSFIRGTVDEYRDDAIAMAIGDDVETKKKVLYHYDRIKDEATTKEQIRKKVRAALRLAGDDEPENPLFHSTPSLGGGDMPRRKKGFGDTEVGKTLAKSLGMSWAQDDKK